MADYMESPGFFKSEYGEVDFFDIYGEQPVESLVSDEGFQSVNHGGLWADYDEGQIHVLEPELYSRNQTIPFIDFSNYSGNPDDELIEALVQTEHLENVAETFAANSIKAAFQKMVEEGKPIIVAGDINEDMLDQWSPEWEYDIIEAPDDLCPGDDTFFGMEVDSDQIDKIGTPTYDPIVGAYHFAAMTDGELSIILDEDEQDRLYKGVKNAIQSFDRDPLESMQR